MPAGTPAHVGPEADKRIVPATDTPDEQAAIARRGAPPPHRTDPGPARNTSHWVAAGDRGQLEEPGKRLSLPTA